MNTKTQIILLIFGIGLSAINDNAAEISFHDGDGQLHKVEMAYKIKSAKTQFGIKYGIDLLNIPIKKCSPVLPDTVEEYFAAFIELPAECNPKNVYQEISTHGANFVFFYFKDSESAKILENYDNLLIPLFIIVESINNFNFFDKKYKIEDKVYIDISFLAVL
jgi:hypothetical protein